MGEGCWLLSREPQHLLLLLAGDLMLFVTRGFALPNLSPVESRVSALQQHSHILSVPILPHACSLDLCGVKNYPDFLYHVTGASCAKALV